jgi:uncharacterized SAM-binding protein YcdF (DUF218 family)
MELENRLERLPPETSDALIRQFPKTKPVLPFVRASRHRNYLSKIVCILPVILVFSISGFLLRLFGVLRISVVCLTVSSVLFTGVAIFPIGQEMTHLLETRFPRWTSSDDNIDGILLLGGSVARIIEAAKLFHRFPNARLIAVTGAPEMGETAVTLDLLSQLGVDVNRVELDGTSHNTFENAEAAKRIAKPRPGDHWLLVTSALHMPRAMGCFRSVGFDVEPYPVDYRHSAAPRLWAHEFIGLAGYWLTGRSTSLWPGP